MKQKVQQFFASLEEAGNEYRPIPFWSWNEKLNTAESVRQVHMMADAGIGGFFMHARGGLQTEYMGEEWFDNVAACIDAAKECGMKAWAYDENGWPSGFGGGKVNGKGEKYWQKYLRYCPVDEMEKIPKERVLACDDAHCFYYEVNPFYVDTLDGEVIADFIKEIYQPYYDRFGNNFEGFFTDEPQVSRDGIPWSLTLPVEYEKAYGESLCEHLGELFFAQEGHQKTRMQFWRLITDLFSANYMKQIHDFCQAHGIRFTGHLVLEEDEAQQVISNGACMPHYEYFDIPGMDWLGRDIFPCLTMMQLSSAAAQTGKRQILSETFATCGHNVGHDELKRNYEWMMVRGINLMCQHLEGYSLRGIRKRDYPPAMYEQQPWWPDYKAFNDAMSRMGTLLAKGEVVVDTLVMHNQTSAWICFDNDKNEGLKEYENALLGVMDALERKHIPYHLGDETLMQRHGHVEGDTLVIGQMRYKNVILPPHIAFFDHTEKLLQQFKENGGQILTVEQLPDNDIIDDPDISYTLRRFPEAGVTLHYFVNSTDKERKATVRCGGWQIDLQSGRQTPFCGSYTFPPYSSLVVIDDGTPACAEQVVTKPKKLPLDGAWQVVSATENALTLDKCSYWFDGVLQQENSYVLDIGNRALALKRPVDVLCRYTVRADYVPDTLYLACETPSFFSITINGKPLVQKDCGYFRDRSFRKLDISGMFHVGENVIETRMLFTQSEEVYACLEKSRHFESEKNKLTYDREIEAMYLVGHFGVMTDGDFEPIERKASFVDDGFRLCVPPDAVHLQHLERQGYLFFAGELTVGRTIHLASGDTARRLVFAKEGINAVRIQVNGKTLPSLLWPPYECDLTPYLHEGDNDIRLTLVNNLRNLLGPHHHTSGELYGVDPSCFYRDLCVWNGYRKAAPYTERYCFVNTSLIEA